MEVERNSLYAELRADLAYPALLELQATLGSAPLAPLSHPRRRARLRHNLSLNRWIAATRRRRLVGPRRRLSPTVPSELAGRLTHLGHTR